MQYDEMMNALGSISPRYETTLEILSDTIGYEFTVDLLKPFFEYILPKKDSIAVESFLKAIDEVAAKLYFFRDGASQDVYYSRIEDFVAHYELPPKQAEKA